MFRIHVHAPTIQANRAKGTRKNVIIVRDDRLKGGVILVHEAVPMGEATIVHKPDEPLSHTGGRAVSWVEVHGKLLVRPKEGSGLIECCPENQDLLDIRSLDELEAAKDGF